MENLPTSSGEANQEELSSDKAVLQQQILKIHNEIQTYERRGTQYYGKRGLALAKLKLMYFIPCVKCRIKEAMMFEILSCKRCSKSSQSRDFFDEINSIINYKISHINLLIKFGGLCSQFHKLNYAKLSLTDVKKYMKHLQKAMSEESHFFY